MQISLYVVLKCFQDVVRPDTYSFFFIFSIFSAAIVQQPDSVDLQNRLEQGDVAVTRKGEKNMPK